jgi:hypothetical protein
MGDMKEKAAAYVEPNPITDEEKAIQMGGEPSDESSAANTEDTEGTGTQDTKPSDQETEKPTEKEKVSETKADPNVLTADEQKEFEGQGFKITTDEKGRSYVTDDEGSKIPPRRFRQIYQKSKEADTTKEKLGLFKKLGADEFYKLYPEETPEGYTPPEPARPAPARAPVGANNVLDSLVTGGTYDGMTLRSVMEVDLDAGTQMLNAWKDEQIKIQIEEDRRVNESHQSVSKETNEFGLARAKELFGVSDLSKITPEQNRQLYIMGREVLDWQEKNNRLNLTFEEAYKLMKHDDLVKKAREEGAKGAFKGLQKSGPFSIDTSGGGNMEPSGWEDIAAMDDKRFGEHVDTLGDIAFKKLLKEAPASVRIKHPGIDWK